MSGRPTISIIAALDRRGCIGRDNALPWRLPDDLKHFKDTTRGHTVIMGRRTFQSPEGPLVLPNRTCIVLTRDRSFAHEGVHVVHTFDDALALAAGEDEVFVIGGAEVYRIALPEADRLYLTWVDADVGGDVYFPPFDRDHWRLVDERRHDADARHAYAFRICTYERRRDEPRERDDRGMRSED